MFIFDWINKFLDGKKTAIGLIGATATLLSLIVENIMDGFTYNDVQVIVGAFSAYMVAIGLGHKAAKIEEMAKK